MYLILNDFRHNGKRYVRGNTTNEQFPSEILKDLILVEEKETKVVKVAKEIEEIEGKEEVNPVYDWQSVDLPDIIIPHHNRWDLIGKCLENIPMCFKVFVIRGFTYAEANNLGASLSKANRICIVNDDCIVKEKALWELCNKTEDIVGVPLYIPSLDRTVYGMNMYWDDKHKYKLRTSLEIESPECQIPNTGAFFMIKRKVFNDLGGFYEGYKNGGEDNELNLLAIERGYSFGHIDTVCEHYHSSSEGRYDFDQENHDLLVERFPKKRLGKILGEKAIKYSRLYPLISVIIPSKGDKKKLRYMKFLKKQTYPNIEIIISRDLERKGANWARNQGWKRAKGKYLFFLDDDCELKPNCLEIMEGRLRRSKASYVYCNYRRIGYEWNEVKDGTHFTIPFDLNKLKKGNYISTMSLIKAKDFPKEGFDEKIKRFQDWDLWLTMAEQGKYGEQLNEILFTAHYKKGDISMNTKNYEKSVKIIKKKHNL